MSVLQRFIETIIPFLIIGFLIAITGVMVIMFLYILLWGLAIGLVLSTLAWLKNKIFPVHTRKVTRGRVIEHDHL